MELRATGSPAGDVVVLVDFQRGAELLDPLEQGRTAGCARRSDAGGSARWRGEPALPSQGASAVESRPMPHFLVEGRPIDLRRETP